METKTDAELIEEAEKLSERATPGPWWSVRKPKSEDGWPTDSPICFVAKGQGVFADCEKGSYPASDQDFIAAARSLIPELASRLKAANEKLAQAERALKIAGVPIGVGLIGDRPLTDAEKAGAVKYEAKAKQLSGINDDN